MSERKIVELDDIDYAIEKTDDMIEIFKPDENGELVSAGKIFVGTLETEVINFFVPEPDPEPDAE